VQKRGGIPKINGTVNVDERPVLVQHGHNQLGARPTYTYGDAHALAQLAMTGIDPYRCMMAGDIPHSG